MSDNDRYLDKNIILINPTPKKSHVCLTNPEEYNPQNRCQENKSNHHFHLVPSE